jgi:hypothetical protein
MTITVWAHELGARLTHSSSDQHHSCDTLPNASLTPSSRKQANPSLTRTRACSAYGSSGRGIPRQVMKISSWGQSALTLLILMHVTRGVSRSSDLKPLSSPLIWKRIHAGSARPSDKRNQIWKRGEAGLEGTPQTCGVRTKMWCSDIAGPLRLKGGQESQGMNMTVHDNAWENKNLDHSSHFMGTASIHVTFLDPVPALQDAMLAPTRHFKPGQRIVQNSSNKARFSSSQMYADQQARRNSMNNLDMVRLNHAVQRPETGLTGTQSPPISSGYGSLRVIIPENAQPGQYIEVMIPGTEKKICTFVEPGLFFSVRGKRG